MPIKAVFFDVGETLVDETHQWGEWADFLGVTRLAFFAALGAVIERRGHHREVFGLLRPGLSHQAARQARGPHGGPTAADFYPDALPCLRALKARGYLLGVSGNQPAEVEALLRSLDLGLDVVASSASWGVEKPDPRFFGRIVRETGLRPAEIAYVGDRLDNDVLPALGAGMRAVFIRRGPWGHLHAAWPEAARASARIEGLGELAGLLPWL